MVSESFYLLSWKAHASDANYNGMKIIDEKLVNIKLSHATYMARCGNVFIADRKVNDIYSKL